MTWKLGGLGSAKLWPCQGRHCPALRGLLLEVLESQDLWLPDVPKFFRDVVSTCMCFAYLGMLQSMCVDACRDSSLRQDIQRWLGNWL